MAVSEVVESFVTRSPKLLSATLWLATRYSIARGKDPNWRTVKLAAKSDFRAPVVTKLGNGMKCRVPWLDEAGRSIHRLGWYEADTVAVLSKTLKPGHTFLDIGASFGQFTLMGAGIVGGGGRVVAFEPDPLNRDWLARNIALNGLRNVQVEPIALGAESSTLDLYVGTPGNFGATSMRKQYNASGRTVEVAVHTLDAYCAGNEVGAVDVIKLDVEGAELLVLQGARDVLAARPTLVVEFEESNQRRFGHSCAELAAFLRERGYALHTIRPGGDTEPFADHHVREMPSFNVLAKA
jgi:FkbM family methyltransferase